MNLNQVESIPEWTQSSSPSIFRKIEEYEHSHNHQQFLGIETEGYRLLESISHRICQSQDLATILQKTIKEVRHFLDCDRVLIYRFETDHTGIFIAESTITAGISLLGQTMNNTCFYQEYQEYYKQGSVHIIEDINSTRLHPCQRDFLTSIEVRANLVIPILLKQDLWGLLIIQHCRGTRQWQQQEIDILQCISMQFGMATQQTQLQQQIQNLQIQIESERQEYRNNLQRNQKFQVLLQRILEKIRDSLDAKKLLPLVTQELADLFQLNSCQIELYNPSLTSTTVTYEYSSSLPNCQGLIREIADFPQIYQSLFQKQIWQSVEIMPGYYSSLQMMSQLACPIFDDQGILGNIWLTRQTETKFGELEISCLQQISNECAIAIRQSQLQAQTKAQIKEIEKQERHKHEFLKHLSQELRTPITNISLAAQTLESLMTPTGILDPEIVPQLLQILHNECGRENKLLNDLLTFAYLKTHPEPPTLITIDFPTWLFPIVESFRDVTSCQQQHLHLDIQSEIPDLSTDITDLEKIITLLLNQACQCTPAGKSITVSAHLNAETVELKISISGVEIPHHELSQVFQPFYRIPKHSSWQAQNTGLELILVKTMVQRLNGLIHVASANSQITFTMQFPLHPVF
jgi:GAF domain-containing protein